MIEKKNFYINGSWVAPKNPIDIKVINPATEKDCAVISLGGKEDINDAVLANTASLISSLPPNEITAQSFSVAGLITLISIGFFGATHEPLI